MSTTHRRLTSTSLICAAVLSAVAVTIAAPARAESAASSSAYGLNATFDVGDLVTGLGPVALVQGSAPPAYNRTDRDATLNKVIAIIPSSAPTVSLFVNAVGLKSHAASNGIGIDFVSAEGDATVQSANLSVNLNPLPPGATSGPVPQPFLQVSGTAINSTANFSQVFPSPPSVTGSATFGNLVISGSLLGNNVLHFSGSAAPNTVLYKSPTITVTLNHQVVPLLIHCTPASDDCTRTPTSITSEAVNIKLDHAEIRGTLVSGEIVVAQAQAR